MHTVSHHKNSTLRAGEMFLAAGALALFSLFTAESASAAMGRKSNICGSWNNYCRGAPPPRQPPPTRQPTNQQPSGPSEEELERQREEDLRRKREEEARRLREEVEREQKRRESEARRRQFMRDKSDALRSLKGADFDGSGSGLKLKSGSVDLKSGTSTFGIKPNPGRRNPLTLLPSSTVEREPLFSKGSKFSAPVDLRDKDPNKPFVVDPKKVAGLVPGGDVGNFVYKKNWHTQTKAGVMVGLVLMERGHYDQAAWFLKRARLRFPKEEFLRDAVAAVKKKAKAKRRLSPLPQEAQAAMRAAIERMKLGDTATAVRMARRARRLTPNDKELHAIIQKIENLHAGRSPAYKRYRRELAARQGRAAKWAKGQAAFKLGFILAAQSDLNQKQEHRNWAQHYLAEARLVLGGRDREVIDRLRRRIGEKKPLRNPGAVADKRKRFYRTKADAMLDALEFGKGDWKAASQYLNHVQQAFPFDPTIADAQRELSAIRQSKGKEITRK